jgi:spermidine/putrescine transport system substrate-binding protein
MTDNNKKIISPTRRSFIKNSAVAGVAASIAPWIISSDALASSGELKIMNWAGYLPDEVKEKFEKDTGIKVKFTQFGSNQELINKMKATRGRGFDIVGPTSNMMPQWRELELLNPWDMSRVPTDKILAPMLRTSMEHGEWDGKHHHLPYLWGTEALAWNTEKLDLKYKELSYGDLFSPDVEGFVMARPHSMMLGVGLYLDATGQLPSNRMLDAYKDEENMRRIWGEITKYCVERKSWIKQFWADADAQKNGFTQNNVKIGQVWDGPAMQLKTQGKPIQYMAPQEGALTWLDGLAMPVGARNVDAVYAFIEYLYSAEVGGLLANTTGYNSCAAGADQFISDQAKKNFLEAYPDDALDRLWWWPAEPSWYAGIRAQYRDKFIAA